MGMASARVAHKLTLGDGCRSISGHRRLTPPESDIHFRMTAPSRTGTGDGATQVAAPAAVPADRLATVDRARNSWINRLVDLSRRNNLLYFRDLKVGTLDLTHVEPDQIRRLLQSGRSPDDGVSLPDLSLAQDRQRAAAVFKEISARARANFEERGLDTLFFAIGLASWKTDDGGRDACAPVLLVPVEIVQRGVRIDTWRLRRAGEVKVSDVVLHALATEHGISVDGSLLLDDLRGDDEGEEFNPEPLFQALRESATKVPEFRIEPRSVLGNFAFQKMAIVRDLKELLEPLARHDIVAALAGDAAAIAHSREGRVSVDPREFDAQLPDSEFLVLDADSSQQLAIVATLNGHNGVISGPPGTGKSQTISNLIAEMVARGKTVLFVAEKRAALDVVLSRLTNAGLGHLCLDCHGADISRKLVAQQLAQSLELLREAQTPDTTDQHRRFVERRDRLNAHVRAMHIPRAPSGMGLHSLYGTVLRLPQSARSDVRFSGSSLKRLDLSTLRSGCELLEELGTLADLFLGLSPSPWLGAILLTETAAREAIERSRRLTESLPLFKGAFDAFSKESGVSLPTSCGDLQQTVDALEALYDTCTAFDASIFAADLEELRGSLRPARSILSRLVAVLFRPDYRAALAKVRALHRNGQLASPAAADAVDRAASQVEIWRQICLTRLPELWGTWPATVAAWRMVRDDLDPIQSVVSSRRFAEIGLEDLLEFIQSLTRDTVTPGRVRRLAEVLDGLDGHGIGAVVADIARRRPSVEQWPNVLRHAWVASCIEDVQLGDTTVASFDGRRHDDVVREFKKLDAERLRLAVQRVRRAHALAALESRNRHSAQNSLVQKEAQKKTRHLPLRRLFGEAPDVLLALRPCWMASPLSVSQLVPGDRPHFDVVIFDEASQVLPEDAVTSLMRGRQAVVAGDQHQLPPTTFFAAGNEHEEDQEDETAGFQSILDQMTAFLEPPWSLDWHYRSRDESLIAYSNHRIYGGRLVTFPGAASTPALRHELVPHVLGTSADDQSASGEVGRVIELILEHARTRPSESLGVIAMGVKHANRIEAELYRRREMHPELEEFFAVEHLERFFVKNLERVQGDERDAIILSVGYGKNEAGQVQYRFGPLLQEGGERRLNVAITRARSRMTVVSSFSYMDLDPNYKKDGVRHLRAFLEYVGSGGRTLGLGTATDAPLNDFEQSVHDELARRGLKLTGQVGSSRYRIDLVAMHPRKPGRYVLAIECDGASYHAAPTARDRDRLRQQQLEALGWRFCRVWSTDWFLRREEEVQRVLKAFDESVHSADELDAREDSLNPRSVVAPRPEAGLSKPPLTGAVASAASQSPVPSRGVRPRIPSGLKIKEYSSINLNEMVRWVTSDGVLRTDDEIVGEVMQALGFERRGREIVERILTAVMDVRLRG